MQTRVLEIGGAAAGFCGRLYRHGGADVVRVEGLLPAPVDRDLETFLHAGKRRLETHEPSLLAELAETADVIVAEATPRELEAIGWKALGGPNTKARVAITPFGLSGPRKDWHASAAVILAMGGYTYIMGDPDKPPLTLPGHYTEFQSGQYAFIAAGACQFADTPGTRDVDVSMLETILSLSQMTTVMWTSNGVIRPRTGSSFGVLYPINLFPCADGWFYVNVVPGFWRPFCEMMERADIVDDERFATALARVAHREDLDQIICEAFRGYTKDEILKLAEHHRVPTGAMKELDEVLVDPHLEARDFWCTITEDGVSVRSPSLGFRFRGDPTCDLTMLARRRADG